MTSGFIAPALGAVEQHWRVTDIPCQREALAVLKRMENTPHAVCIGRTVDIGDDLDAWDMLREVQAVAPGVPVIISTSQRSPKVIVDLVKGGAFDYVVEPGDPADHAEVDRYVDDLVLALSRAVELRRVVLENEQLRHDLVRQGLSHPIRGRSRQIQRVLDLVHKVAPTTATVLITGESGTGKELVARAIHAASGREREPFLALNCGSFSEQLVASELFGYEKGAFTGADSVRAGLVREAGGGTLFLDEIATVGPAFQTMLLRVLEQRVARPVGGNRDYDVCCRFVAAANTDLEQMVREGSFRGDLFYRLNVFSIHVPPLRERREDIPVLAEHFVREACREYGKSLRTIGPGALALLERADWPGNVRQLRHAIERAVIVSERDLISAGDLDERIRACSEDDVPDGKTAPEYDAAMRGFEWDLISRALTTANGNRSAAARALGIKRSRLNYRLRLLGIDEA